MSSEESLARERARIGLSADCEAAGRDARRAASRIVRQLFSTVHFAWFRAFVIVCGAGKSLSPDGTAQASGFPRKGQKTAFD